MHSRRIENTFRNIFTRGKGDLPSCFFVIIQLIVSIMTVSFIVKDAPRYFHDKSDILLPSGYYFYRFAYFVAFTFSLLYDAWEVERIWPMRPTQFLYYFGACVSLGGKFWILHDKKTLLISECPNYVSEFIVNIVFVKEVNYLNSKLLVFNFLLINVNDMLQWYSFMFEETSLMQMLLYPKELAVVLTLLGFKFFAFALLELTLMRLVFPRHNVFQSAPIDDEKECVGPRKDSWWMVGAVLSVGGLIFVSLAFVAFVFEDDRGWKQEICKQLQILCLIAVPFCCWKGNIIKYKPIPPSQVNCWQGSLLICTTIVYSARFFYDTKWSYATTVLSLSLNFVNVSFINAMDYSDKFQYIWQLTFCISQIRYYLVENSIHIAANDNFTGFLLITQLIYWTQTKCTFTFFRVSIWKVFRTDLDAFGRHPTKDDDEEYQRGMEMQGYELH